MMLPVKYLLTGLYWIPKGIYLGLEKLLTKKKSFKIKKKALITDNEAIDDANQQEKHESIKSGESKESLSKTKQSENKKDTDVKFKKNKSDYIWNGETKNDGGSLLKKSKLPEPETKLGKTFYYIAENKFIGVDLQSIAKQLQISLHEAFFYIITLVRQGLIGQRKECKRLEDDVWDLVPEMKKIEPELEKLIERAGDLYEWISEGIITVKAELQGELLEIEEIIEEPIQRLGNIPVPKPVNIELNLSKKEKSNMNTITGDKIPKINIDLSNLEKIDDIDNSHDDSDDYLDD